MIPQARVTFNYITNTCLSRTLLTNLFDFSQKQSIIGTNIYSRIYVQNIGDTINYIFIRPETYLWTIMLNLN